MKPKIQMIRLDDITVPPDRMRQLRPDLVDELAESIKQQGQLQPIIIRPQDSGYALTAGHHRLAAVRKLGHEAIECRAEDQPAPAGCAACHRDCGHRRRSRAAPGPRNRSRSNRRAPCRPEAKTGRAAAQTARTCALHASNWSSVRYHVSVFLVLRLDPGFVGFGSAGSWSSPVVGVNSCTMRGGCRSAYSLFTREMPTWHP
jgi:ParB-like nuclease domain